MSSERSMLTACTLDEEGCITFFAELEQRGCFVDKASQIDFCSILWTTFHWTIGAFELASFAEFLK